MSGRYALIIGNTEYIDPGLAQLTAPGKDAGDFARVLKDQEIGAFDDVNILLNQPEPVVRGAIDEFFDQKKPDDLLVLYFSGHGVRDELGALYLAVKNTSRSRLRSTAVKSDYIREAMDQSRSNRQVLILDCCNSGAFAQGTKAATGVSIGTASAFEGGFGRIILTASDATQFAWEGDKVIGETDNSLFTHYLVEGLEGEADQDGDGRITVDELYDYAYEKVRLATPKQTPSKFSSKQQGEIVLRQSTRIENIKPLPLPDELMDEIEDTRPYVREAAVQKLEKILKGKNIGLARSAREALERIAEEDDSRNVASAAKKSLEYLSQLEQLTTQKIEEERLAKDKAEAERKAKEEAVRLARERAQAIRTAREREQLERQLRPRVTSNATSKERIQKQKSQNQSTRQIKPILGGIALIAILCSITGAMAWKYIFSPQPTQIPTSTQLIVSIPPITDTPTFTPTATLTPTLTPAHTVTYTPTLKSQVPVDPADFLIYYFDTVIIDKDFSTGWSLQTPAYQSGKSQGWNTFINFWGMVRDWNYSPPQVEYNNNTRARVLITYTLFYKDGTIKPSLLDGVRYCLLWEETMDNWQIDLRENCP